MKPILAIAVLLFALIVAAAATSEEMESTCKGEMERHPLNKCSLFTKYGQRDFLLMGKEENNGSARECCRELKQIKEECRCPMIKKMMHQIREEEGFTRQKCRGRCREMMMMGSQLPSMCDVEPGICRMRQHGVY